MSGERPPKAEAQTGNTSKQGIEGAKIGVRKGGESETVRDLGFKDMADDGEGGGRGDGGSNQALTKVVKGVNEVGVVSREVEGEGKEDTKVLVRFTRREERNRGCANTKTVMELGMEEGSLVPERRGKASGDRGMEGAGDSTLTGIEGEATPSAIGSDLCELV